MKISTKKGDKVQYGGAEMRVVHDPMVTTSALEASSRLSSTKWMLTTTALPKPVRVRLDRNFYGKNFHSAEFWMPGSPTFPDATVVTGGPMSGRAA